MFFQSPNVRHDSGLFCLILIVSWRTPIIQTKERRCASVAVLICFYYCGKTFNTANNYCHYHSNSCFQRASWTQYNLFILISHKGASFYQSYQSNGGSETTAGPAKRPHLVLSIVLIYPSWWVLRGKAKARGRESIWPRQPNGKHAFYI